MPFQAYVDDSEDQDGTYVLAGYIADTEAWNRFTSTWQPMLRSMGVLAPQGHYHFHMVEMNATEERRRRIPAFLRVINDHVALAISISIKMSAWEEGKSRIWTPGYAVDWSRYDNPYVLAFRGLMDTFHNNKEILDTIIPAVEPVDFVFDETSQKKSILWGWKSYLDHRDAAVRRRYGKEPRFAHDHVDLPLQAADAWAWWVRKQYAERDPTMKRWRRFGSKIMKNGLAYLKHMLD